jgi:hypothetical protein
MHNVLLASFVSPPLPAFYGSGFGSIPPRTGDPVRDSVVAGSELLKVLLLQYLWVSTCCLGAECTKTRL